MNADGVLVVGYGNPLRGDDAVGHRVADLLASDRLLPGATIVARHQLTPELADQIAAARLVVLVDARQDGGRPGDVRIERVVRSGRPLGSHTVEVSTLVDLTELVYGNAPPVVLVTVNAEQFDLGADLSSVVASAISPVVDAVVAVVETLITEPGRWDQGPVVVGHQTIRTAPCSAHDQVVGTETSGQRRRWGTPTGDPCPRLVHLDGRVEGTGECQGCGFCLLLAGLVDLPEPTEDGPLEAG